MQDQGFLEVTSTRNNPHIDPSLHVWGWEVPVYLFLGGLVAGLLILNAYVVLARRKQQMPTTSGILPILCVPLLAVGLGSLFLDLEYKLHVFRFYTSFQATSPMSWGSWILLFVFATSGLSGLSAYLRTSWPFVERVRSLPLVPALDRFASRHERSIAKLNGLLGLALGIYTGILLSNLTARPLWSSGLFGLLFPISGLSTGAALGAILARDHHEKENLIRIDVALIGAELLILGLWILSMASGNEASRAAAMLILGGPYTAAFWTLVVGIGLVVPFLLETLALSGRLRETPTAPVLVLVGGLSLRFILVSAGQGTGY